MGGQHRDLDLDLDGVGWVVRCNVKKEGSLRGKKGVGDEGEKFKGKENGCRDLTKREIS